MKAIKILETYESLTTLADKDLDLITACNIAKNLQELGTPKQIIEQKRTKLIQEYSKKDGDGNPIVNEQGGIALENEEELVQKLNELFENDIDVNLIKIKKSDLGDIKISPKVALGFMDILED